MKKINVLEVGPGDFGRSGLSVIVWSWYENFDHDKISADFISCSEAAPQYTDKIKALGGEFYYISEQGLIARQPAKYSAVKKAAAQKKYDCIHIHTSDALEGYVYCAAAKRVCKNVIVHSHSSGIDCGSFKPDAAAKVKGILHRICRLLMRGDKITRFACSAPAGEWLFSDKCGFTVINNGIDTSKFVFNEAVRGKIRGELGLDGKFVVGHIGRFDYQKNHDFLIDIFNEVYKRNKNSVLLLIGEGELKEKIREKVHGLGLDEAVIFYGLASNANELYQAMDCFVLPSNFEGLGIVVIEAQAAGLKTICSDVVPKEAQITDLLEYMSLLESAEKWADKILTYSESYERADMSEKIENAGFDIKKSAEQLEKLYIGFGGEQGRSR